jgi:hypothetical protein
LLRSLLWIVILIFIGVIEKSLLSGCFKDAIASVTQLTSKYEKERCQLWIL